MSVITSLWWPEDRIQATLCSEYIFNHLPSNILHRLVTPLPWGEGLTSETYLDWILAKAGRLFLILVDIGIPERIFALVDESLDDSDLPIAAHSVDRLHLSPDAEDPALDSKFFLAQWRFVVRGIGEGEHVKYTENEGVPVELLRTGAALARDGVERVVLAGSVCRVYLRTQVTVGGPPHFFEEDEVLEEVRSLRRLSHEHVYSIFGSYFVDNTVCILFSGVYERTLMSFLTDVPPQFKRLSKERRRETLVNWPHCLANGLSWFHAQNQVHGGIRPSNIFIDADLRIFLGQFEALDTLLPPVKIDDVESYQYGAPERWVRFATVQDTGPSRTALPSGGRTARKPSSRPSRLSFGIRKESYPPDHEATDSRPESMLSQGTAIRVVSPGSPSRFSFGPSSSSGSSGGSARKRVISSVKRPIFYTPSITSSNSSGSSSHQTSLGAVSLPLSHSHAAVVHSWQSCQTNPKASDIFSLGAVTVDIFTHLCKRKISSFVHHRGAKNRTAGRGGGVADCSFHLDRNMAQVTSWITLLDQDAKKQKSPVFQAVRAMLSMSRGMLSKDPVGRPSASQVDHCFSSAIRQLGGVANLHCSSYVHLVANESKSPVPRRKHTEETPELQVLDVPSESATPTPVSPSKHLTVYDHSCIDPGGTDGLNPSPAASMTNFNFCFDRYQDSDDTDQECGGCTTGSDQPPWLDPDQALSPAAVNDPAWDYSFTLRDG
ncbi:protein kinase domain-containing protein [Aspergillus affinis]|uniref:protein kinase domain-containing protein n=1 Tax=Aspergillus affinis TaxID=1070780 RepID=UPI0022FE391F|nr:uncharacterized protein KD926_002122 [Aspergillus affinis]KAI9036304.1 hypothetical protein KD926_002122 [Aspergillus affinis]